MKSLLSYVVCCCFLAAPFLSSCSSVELQGLAEALIAGAGEVSTEEESVDDTASYDTTMYDTSSASYATQEAGGSPMYPRRYYRGDPPRSSRAHRGPHREPRPGARPQDRRGPKPGARPQDRRGPKPGARPQDRRGPKPGARPQDRRGPKPGARPQDRRGTKPGAKPSPGKPGSSAPRSSEPERS